MEVISDLGRCLSYCLKGLRKPTKDLSGDLGVWNKEVGTRQTCLSVTCLSSSPSDHRNLEPNNLSSPYRMSTDQDVWHEQKEKRETREIILEEQTKQKVMDEVKDYFAVGEKEYHLYPLVLLVVE
jgi:hypothetical protein